MPPLPAARPKPVDVAFARPRPPETIAIALAAVDYGYRYAAVGDLQCWSEFIPTPSKEAALLEAIGRIRSEHGRHLRMRFLVNLPGTSVLWRQTPHPQWWIERPDTSEQDLITAAAAQLTQAPPVPVSLPIDAEPMTVATDGSLRDHHAGFAWLTHTGHYGIAGYHSSTKTVGKQPVLVAELLAIGDAVRELTRRKLSIASDSREAVAMVNRWKRGEDAMPGGYPDDGILHAVRRQIRADRHRLDVRWARGHCGEPLNEGADALARLASRYQRGDRDVRGDECRRRAAGIADGFAAEYRRRSDLSA